MAVVLLAVLFAGFMVMVRNKKHEQEAQDNHASEADVIFGAKKQDKKK